MKAFHLSGLWEKGYSMARLKSLKLDGKDPIKDFLTFSSEETITMTKKRVPSLSFLFYQPSHIPISSLGNENFETYRNCRWVTSSSTLNASQSNTQSSFRAHKSPASLGKYLCTSSKLHEKILKAFTSTKLCIRQPSSWMSLYFLANKSPLSSNVKAVSLRCSLRARSVHSAHALMVCWMALTLLCVRSTLSASSEVASLTLSMSPQQSSCHVSDAAAACSCSSTALSSPSIRGYSTSRRVCFSLLYACTRSSRLPMYWAKKDPSYVKATLSTLDAYKYHRSPC